MFSDNGTVPAGTLRDTAMTQRFMSRSKAKVSMKKTFGLLKCDKIIWEYRIEEAWSSRLMSFGSAFGKCIQDVQE